MNSYGDYTVGKRAEGDEYEDFVIDELYKIGLPIVNYKSRVYQYMVGENKTGIEIKFDGNLKKRGNFYIETAEKSHPDNENYVASGIYRKDNSWLWAIGNRERIHIYGKKDLKLLYASKKYQEVENETHTSKGFLLPTEKSKLPHIGDAEKYALKIIICKGNKPYERTKSEKKVRFACGSCDYKFDVFESEIISNLVRCPRCKSNACDPFEEWEEFKKRLEEVRRWEREESRKYLEK